MNTKAQERAAAIAQRKREAFMNKARGLLGHVSIRIMQSEADAAFDAGMTADTFAAQVASREPVGRAVHAQKVDSVNRAEKEAREFVARVMAEMEKAGWDLEAAAPYPRGLNSWSSEFKAKRDRHNTFSRLTTADKSKGYQSYGRAPYFVVRDDKAVERFVQEARDMAAGQYDAFICKLVSKVGECKDATLEGSHVWGYSHLTVTLLDGSTQVWRTQQILNWSVLGNPYNQWPTRLLKGGA